MTPQPWTRRLPGLTLALVLAVSLSGCVLARPSLPGSDRQIDGDLGWKVVLEKREPNLLVAVDRSVCEVSFERFEEVERDDRVLCHWRGSGRSRARGPFGGTAPSN